MHDSPASAAPNQVVWTPDPFENDNHMGRLVLAILRPQIFYRRRCDNLPILAPTRVTSTQAVSADRLLIIQIPPAKLSLSFRHGCILRNSYSLFTSCIYQESWGQHRGANQFAKLIETQLRQNEYHNQARMCRAGTPH